MQAVRKISFLLGIVFCPALAVAQAPDSWDFIVRLDGRPVGTHRFVLENDGAETLKVFSQARFDVKLLGLTVYSYRHQARETWRGGCLAAIDAKTDDDGKRAEVRGSQTAAGFTVVGSNESAPCLMTFAYWNPRLREQTRLLDPGTGRIVPVRIEKLAGAQAWRITGLPNPIDVLWDGDRWAGLDTFAGGRRLTYRLQ